MAMLTGNVAPVTGSSQGIGAGTARSLARYGADVGINYRRSKELAEEVCPPETPRHTRGDWRSSRLLAGPGATYIVGEVTSVNGGVHIA